MAKQRLLMLFLAAACSLTQAEEILVVGSVQRISLLPARSEQCPSPCPQTSTPQPDGSTRVCISNSCGCQVTDLKIDKVLLGDAKGATLQVKESLGEWCRPTFPVSSRPLLVHVKDGSPRWSGIVAQDGVEKIDAKPFATIGAVTVSSLQDAEGKVRLDALREHLSQQR